MAAGHSAAHEAALFELEAEQHEDAARTAREMHRRYSAAASSEQALGRMLEPLQERGFHVLSDRKWPRARGGAQVDFVLVGPSGVIIVDAKSWAEVQIAGDRVYQGQDDVTERFDGLAALCALVQTELADLGLAPGETRAVGVFTNRRGIRARVSGVDLVGIDGAVDYLLRGVRLGPEQVELALQRILILFPPYVERLRPIARFLPRVIPITRQQALVSSEELEQSLLAHEHAKPIEDWMAWLHPEQARLAKRSFSGPSRVRGSAGTGKTVVGLHRAAHLARTRPERVLVTTFVRTLPDVLSSLMLRMAPEVADRIDFMGVHEFARRVLQSRGIAREGDPKQAAMLFARAWTAVGATGMLGRIDPNSRYWEEEIQAVIKGRGITRFDEYLQLSRVGRRRGLTAEQRHAVWVLYEHYDRLLRTHRSSDYADIILQAERSLRETPLDRYSAVVVDEAQDLSCSMIRMLHHVVGDRPDGLNLIGDGQQTIYPGGYTLSEIGISIAGRGAVMTRNYRNTAEILEFATSMVAGDEFTDIEGDSAGPDAPVEIDRHGATPSVAHFTSRAAHDRALVEHLRGMIRAGCAIGDIGVLAPHTYATRDIHSALAHADIPSIDLLEYRGVVEPAVKVGTIKRAKGLEFKHVLVARAPSKLLSATSEVADTGAAERRALERRELYVAMTRARDSLWVGVI